jgi:hypothetical protein
MRIFYALFAILLLSATSLHAQTPEITIKAWMREIYSREDHDPSREEYRCIYNVNDAVVCVWAENKESQRWELFRPNELIHYAPGSTTSFQMGLRVWENDGGDECKSDRGSEDDSYHAVYYYPRLSTLNPMQDNNLTQSVNNDVNPNKGYSIAYTIFWYSNKLGTPHVSGSTETEICYSQNMWIETSAHGMSSTLSPSYRWEVYDVTHNYTWSYTTTSNQFNVADHIQANPVSTRRIRVRVATYVRGMQASEYYSDPFDLTVNGTPVATISEINDPKCFGQKGEVKISAVTGASDLYDLFLVKDGITVKEYNDLPANTPYTFTGIDHGTYVLKVADRTGPACFQETSVPIAETPSELKWKGSRSDYNGFGVSCSDASDGVISLAAEGGKGSYTYLYEGTPVTSFTGKAPGTYAITVRDENGCFINVSETITAPPTLDPGTVLVTPVSCRNSAEPDGTISVNNVNGGVSPYQYQLDGGAWQTSNVFSALGAKSYSIAIRDRNNCVVYLSPSVTQPATSVSGEVTAKVDATCFGSTNGSFTIKGSGGVPFEGNTYEFSLNGGLFSASSADITYTDLAAGTYQVSVRDKNGCVQQVSVPISQPDPIGNTLSITPVSCDNRSDGKIVITLSDGTAPYFYFDASSGVSKPVDAMTNTVTIDGLSEGSYVLRVKDSNGCADGSGNEWLEIPYTVGTPPPLEAFIEEGDLTAATCIGSSDASATIRARYGTPGYSFSVGGQNYQPSNGAFTFTGLTGGSAYEFFVRDTRACVNTISITMPQPEIPEIGDEVIICPGQSKVIEVPLNGTYLWTSDKGFSSTAKSVTLSEEATYVLHVTTDLNCSIEHTFVLNILDNPLRADLLMADEAMEGDTLVGIDLSYPVPQNRFWDFDSQAVAHIRSESPYEYFQFNKAGIQSIRLVARLGECSDTLIHFIDVRKREQDDQEPGRLGYKELFIRDFASFPNPASQHFTIRIELAAVAGVTVKLIDSFSSQPRFIRTETGSDKYSIEVNAPNLVSGLYFLQLETTTGEKQTIRVVIYN